MGPGRAEPLIFVHIPKTAGTTLRETIRREYREVLEIPRLGEYEGIIDRLTRERLRTFDACMGHMPYGIHELLGGGRYVTVLREPVDRLRSLYQYIRNRPGDVDHQLAHEADFGTFVRSDDPSDAVVRVLYNQQTLFLAGLRDGDLELAKANTPELLERAIANLEDFLVVATQERFDEALVLMSARFGWSLPEGQALNVSPQRLDVDEDTAQVIRERNQLDVQLHAYATDRLARDLRRHRLRTAAYVARRRSGPMVDRWNRRARRRLARVRRRVAGRRG